MNLWQPTFAFVSGLHIIVGLVVSAGESNDKPQQIKLLVFNFIFLCHNNVYLIQTI